MTDGRLKTLTPNEIEEPIRDPRNPPTACTTSPPKYHLLITRGFNDERQHHQPKRTGHGWRYIAPKGLANYVTTPVWRWYDGIVYAFPSAEQ